MPLNAESPVQTQYATRVPDRYLPTGNISGGKAAGRRHVFVQTDTGSVFRIEIDQFDNVQSVKKKMQALLNVSMEQTALTIGDTILKNDLSRVRTDSPVLLTRELQRSLSSPSLSPPSDLFLMQADSGQPLQVVGGLSSCAKVKRMLNGIVEALDQGVEPVAVSGGLGGAYYFRNRRGERLAIVKPTDEEPFAPNNPKGLMGRILGQPGVKRTIRVGETGVREVAAYLLDHGNYAKVPPTALVKVSHHVFHINGAADMGKSRIPTAKIASCQEFVDHDCDASDHGTSRFSVSSVHRIGILDIRVFNTDRHAGNILVRKNRSLDKQWAWDYTNLHTTETLELIPIDHGLCLPEGFEDPYFEWLHWPQASLPFSEEELAYIDHLDVIKDVKMLQRELPMLREGCLRMLTLSTIFLKQAAIAGFCLAEIGEMMSRNRFEEYSELEQVGLQAKHQADSRSACDKHNESDDTDDLGEIFDEGDSVLEQFEFEMDDVGYSGIEAADGNSVFDGKNQNCRAFNGKNQHCRAASLMAEHGLHEHHAVAVSQFHLAGINSWSSISSAQIDHNETADVTNLDGEYCQPALMLQGSSFKNVQGVPTSLNISTPANCVSLNAVNRHMLGRTSSMQASFRPDRCSGYAQSKNLKSAWPSQSPEVSQAPSVVGKADRLAESMASWKLDSILSKTSSFRSESLNVHRQRSTNYSEERVSSKLGVLASAITGKGEAMGNLNPLSLRDMSEEEWLQFLECFQELLPEALAIRSSQYASHRQRLGISCQF